MLATLSVIAFIVAIVLEVADGPYVVLSALIGLALLAAHHTALERRV